MAETIIKQNAIENLERDMAVYSYNINLFRMFPDVRDGEKVVQRRIHYAMKEMGLTHNKPYYKVASVSGSVMGGYHPHGSASIDDALIRMGQDFVMNEMTVMPRGNWGFLSGDPAAASRYIEVKLSEYGELLLEDIDKNAVNWRSNYDGRKQEPETLPSPLPNILINGAVGIGQGFATSIPTHNLGEVIDLTLLYIDNPDIELHELATKIKPDFPTGGIICNSSELYKFYEDSTAEGTIKIRSHVDILDDGNLLIKDIPYMQTTAKILDTIQEKVNDKTIEGISDIIDSTNRKNGVKILIKVKKGYDSNALLNQLYQITPLESSFSINLMCTNGYTFKVYNIKEILQEWLTYRQGVVRRIYNSDYSKLNRRIHIIDGLLIALSDIDSVVAIVKSSKDKQDVINRLKKKYKLTNLQAESIAEMQLYRLSSLDQKKLKDEQKDLKDQQKEIEKVLSDKNGIDNVIKEQLKAIKKKFAKPRKTELADISAVNIEDIIPDENYSVFLTKSGMVKKVDTSVLASRKRGVKGQINKVKEDDVIIKALSANSKDMILFFSNKGRVFGIKAYEIQKSTLTSLGQNVKTYINLLNGEEVVTMLSLSSDMLNNEKSYLIFATRNGLIKRTKVNLYSRVPRNGLIAISLKENDMLVSVDYVSKLKDTTIMMTSKNGIAVRFACKDIPKSLRTAYGCMGMKLNEGDEVIGFNLVTDEKYIFVLTKTGLGKKVELSEFSVVSRNCKGSMICRFKEGSNDELVSTNIIPDDKYTGNIVVLTSNKITKIKPDQIPQSLRPAFGCTIVKLTDKDSAILSVLDDSE